MSDGRKLSILMIAPTPYFSDRGCHVRIYEEARALGKLGHRVQVCTYHLGRDQGEVPTRRIPSVPWYRKQSAGPSWHKPYLDILLFFTALKTARKLKPDVIHAHLHEGAFIGYFLKKLLGMPMVFDCQGSLCGELVDHRFVRKGSPLYRFFRFMERRISNGADFIITSSTPTARLLQEEFGVSDEKLAAVCDGVDTDLFRPGRDVTALRRELKLPADRKVVVFLGAMNEYQGIGLLLDAILLLEKRSDLHFLIMGYPEEHYVAMAERLGIRQRVTFTGRIDYARAPEYLCLGDLAVSPKVSGTEANGKLFNYMACGLPAVVFDTPVNREILGDQGVYAHHGSASALAAGIASLADSGEQRAALARRARETAEAEYSWQVVAEKIVAVYPAAASSAGRKEP